MNSSKSRSTLARMGLSALIVSLTLVFVPAASALNFWGAIAVDPESGITGVASDAPTARAAQRQAIALCEIRGDGCKAAVWVTNGWAALVKKHSGLYVGGFGKTKHAAVANARKRAHEQSSALIRTVFSG